MKIEKIRKIVFAALLTAIICVATFVVQIPIPATGGYVNLGDCFVIISGYILGGFYGALAAGLGSGLADILAGYAQYAPATFVIKAIMAIAFYFIYKAIFKAFGEKYSIISKIISAIIAELIMVGGYFAYEAVILHYGLSAAASIVPNLMQGLVAVIASVIITTAIDKIKFKI
ncbi:MAG: ECF transporter S component [Clostridia bacterium]|nr:ECF transporter S component [Clostridia bacterium]